MDKSDLNHVGGSMVSFSCGENTDGPICDGAGHDVCLYNLLSYIDLDSTKHLQHLALLDHTYKNTPFLWIVIVPFLR